MSVTPLESRIAFIRDLSLRGGFGATLAARDATIIIELALRELLRRHEGDLLPHHQRGEVKQAIAAVIKGTRAKGLDDLTLGQLVGVFRDSNYFELWATATGKPLTALRFIDLNALTRFRNKNLVHIDSLEQLTDPAAQVSPADAKFLLHCVDLLINSFEIISLDKMPAAIDAQLIASLPLTTESPYRGVLPFSAVHRHLFFGRDTEREELLTKVKIQPFVALIGNSGSGKSSLVAAGLLPHLPEETWLTLTLQPRQDLFDSLAAILVPHLYADAADQAAQRGRLARLLAEPDYRLDHLLQGLLTNKPARRIALVIDQFEEVFTLCTEKPRQRSAVELLLSALRGGKNTDIVLLLVLRADFFGRCLDIESLRQMLDLWPAHTLGIMSNEALKTAITRPAELTALRLEDGLSDSIINELGDEPGQLTLLQTALDELWQRSDRRQLTHRGYRDVGGVTSALAQKADEFLKGYNDAGRERLHRIFVQLVRPGEGEEDTRQIATLTQVGAENWELVVQLASARLLVTGRDGLGQETVEVAHEALIRHWQQLRSWIAEDRSFRLWQNKLRDSRAEWLSNARSEGYLLHGARLAEAEERLVEKGDWLADEERSFISASMFLREQELTEKNLQQRERVRLQKRVLNTIVTSLVLALGLSAIAVWQWRVAESSNVLAENNFQKARLTVDDFVADVGSKELADIPGLQDLRERFSRKAISQYSELIKENPSDLDVKIGYAKAKATLGSVLADMGSIEKAIIEIKEAIGLLEANVKLLPNNWHLKLELAKQRNMLADLYWENQQDQKSLPLIELVVQTLEAVLSEHQEDNEVIFQLAKSYNSLGNNHSNQQAKKDYERSVSLGVQIIDTYKDKVAVISLLAKAKSNLSLIYRDEKNFLKSQYLLEEASRYSSDAIKLIPDSSLQQERYANNLSNKGALLQAMGKPVEAKNAYELCLVIRRRIAAANPLVPRFSWDLSVMLSSYASLLSSMGDYSESRKAYEESIHILEQISQGKNAHAFYGAALIANLIALGKQDFVKSGTLPNTSAWRIALDRTIKAAKPIAEKYPTDTSVNLNYFSALYNRAMFDEIYSDKDAALEYYIQALQTYNEHLYKQGESPLSDKVIYFLDTANKAIILASNLNQIKKAKQIKEMAERIGENHETNQGVKYLGEILGAYGLMLKKAGQYVDAIGVFDKELRSTEEAWRKSQWHFPLHRNVGSALANLMELYQKTKHLQLETSTRLKWLEVWGNPMHGIDNKKYIDMNPDLFTEDNIKQLREITSKEYRSYQVSVGYVRDNHTFYISVPIYDMLWPKDPFEYQARWLKETLNGEFDKDRLKYFYKMRRDAHDNHVSFVDLTEYVYEGQTRAEDKNNLINIASKLYPNETAIILLRGKNTSGIPIYAYVSVTLPNIQKLHSAMNSGNDFSPSDFGTIVAQGKGVPSDKIDAEIRLFKKM